MSKRPIPTIRNLPYIARVRVTKGVGDFDGSKLADALEDIQNTSGNVANQIAANPDGVDIVPPKIGGFNVVHLGNGVVDFAITDGGTIQRAIDYIVEASSNSAFSGSRVVHFSPSRNPAPFPLPMGNWWFKAYSQYRHGGPPSVPIVVGPVGVSGQITSGLLGTQGCGVALPGSTGQGAGTTISR